MQSDSGPMLILLNNGRPFHVAAECNGFGMISSCLLMTLIIVLYRRLSLFDRVGRGLVLSETGRFVFEYAEEIFSVGAELAQRVRSRRPGMPAILNVGVANSIPKLIAYRILRPALEIEESVRVVCREGNLEQLLGDLAVHRNFRALLRKCPSG